MKIRYQTHILKSNILETNLNRFCIMNSHLFLQVRILISPHRFFKTILLSFCFLLPIKFLNVNSYFFGLSLKSLKLKCFLNVHSFFYTLFISFQKIYFFSRLIFSRIIATDCYLKHKFKNHIQSVEFQKIFDSNIIEIKTEKVLKMQLSLKSNN